jgi:hypothetical protein
VLSLCLLAPARGQNAAATPPADSPPAATQPADSQPVSREEFEQLQKQNAQILQDNAEMKQQIGDLKKQQADLSTNADQQADDDEKEAKIIQEEIDRDRPGLEGLVISGDANIGFTTQRKTNSTFFADVSPLILWQPVDSHFLVETAFDLGVGGDPTLGGDQSVNSETTTVSLNLGDISYEVTDNLIVGGGLFAVPFGQFHNHFDPPWVNKFTDDPLAFDAIAPVSEVGFYARGAIPSGTTRWTYDVYAANGPNLITNDPNAAGQLNFNDYTDLNNNKAFGGRLGFLPFPDMEMGYSIQYSQPNQTGFQRVHATLQAADFHYKPLVKELNGTFDLAAEWIWSDVGKATYDPTGSAGFGPTNFANYRDGGYVSLCYRPTELPNEILRNFEICTRFDMLRSPISSPGGEHETRYTVGLNYWFASYAVAKFDYEIDQKKVGPDQNAFTFQLGFGL